MKVSAAIAFSATVSVALFNAAMDMSTYLSNIPNGDSFAQALGHSDNDSSEYTEFASAFLAVGLTWTTDFCNADFATTDTTISMTNGDAFGDPCCTWTSGGTPDFTVTAFTVSPVEKTVCASSSTTVSSAATTNASSAASVNTEESTAASTTASSATSSTEEYSTVSSAASASTTEENTEAETETTTAPATTTASPTVSKCNVRRN